jgi:NAD(P)-dependent dehydrogenase (short-subunit alcohol dehydrogenase family)
MTSKKVWFITGASSGIGQALVQALHNTEHIVVATFRQASQVAAFNNENGSNSLAVLMDITNTTQIKDALAQAISTYGKIDVLVNNAGYGLAGAIEETSMQEARNIFEANFFGTLQVTQLALPILRKQQSGHIIQVSSHGGFKAFPGFGMYNATKFAVEGFSEALAAEVAPLGIKVSIVEPGPFRTNFAGSSFLHTGSTIDDYNATAGTFKTKMQAVHGNQEGNPAKAAEAIIHLAEQSNPSLRMPLGKIALLSLQAKLDSVKQDMELHRATAEGAIY